MPVPISLSPCLPLSLSSCLPFSLSPALPRNEAIEHARRTLALIDRGDPISPATLDGGAYPPAFDFFRVEWERAAWTNAGDPLARRTPNGSSYAGGCTRFSPS